MTEEFRRLSVLMPVYNEARTLRTIVKRVLDAPVPLEIELICVDDASSDSSGEVLEDLADADARIRVVHHPVNRGKGAAIRSAIEHMTGDIAIIQDSDLEYDPGDYPKLLKPIVDNRADAVFGSRFAASPERRVLLYWHSLGNRLLTWLVNVLNDINLTDMETCYKAMRTDVLRSLGLTSDRFGIEPEITTRLAQSGARIYEVPISYYGRTYLEGKTIGWRDGIQAVWLLFRFRYLDARFASAEGDAAREGLRATKRFSRWVIDQFRSELGSRVLDAGCGTGNLTTRLLDRERVVAVDVDARRTEVVQRAYGHLENVAVRSLDLEDEESFRSFVGERLDSVVCVNVLEHLVRPQVALEGFHRVLEPSGKALIMVPAHPDLYGAADRALGHERRYTAAELRRCLVDAGFEVMWIRPFYRLGVPVWRYNAARGRTGMSLTQARLVDVAVPLARLLDKIGIGRGLCLVAAARKSG